MVHTGYNVILKSCAVIFSLFFCSESIAAQETVSNFIFADTILNYPDIRSSFKNKIITTQYGRDVIFLQYNTKKNQDTIIVHRLNVDHYKDNHTTIVHRGIAKRMTELKYSEFSCIAFMHQTLALSFDSIIMLYKTTDKKNEFIFQKEIHAPHYFTYMKFINENTLVLADSYLNTNVTHRNVAITSLNIANGTKKTFLPFYNTPLLSFFRPFKYIDVNDNKIVFANRNEYSFLIFDNQYLLCDSVSRVLRKWNSISKKDINNALNFSNQPRDIMDVVRPHYIKDDMLNWVYLIDSNHIMTVCKHDLDSGLPSTIDIWVQTEGQWRLRFKDIKDEEYSFITPSKKITPNTLELNFMGGNTIIAFNDKIVKIDMYGTDIYPIGLTPKEYNKQNEEWLKRNKPYLRVIVYRHSFCR